VTRAASVRSLVWVFGFACTSLVREPTAAAAEDKMVDVVVSGDPDDAAGVEVVVRELVARLPVVLQWSRATGIDPVQVLAQRAPDTRIVTRAWMDLSDRKRARIYVANPWNARFVVRVVPLLDGYDEIAREVLGHIIESCVDAFLAGRATLNLEGTLSSRIGIFIGAGCDVDLDRSTYFVADGMKSTTVLSPWVAHPTAMVGLVFRTQEEPIDEPR
jgi:hypothetical protein